jgi:phospholipid transport system substrate-binding protein
MLSKFCEATLTRRREPGASGCGAGAIRLAAPNWLVALGSILLAAASANASASAPSDPLASTRELVQQAVFILKNPKLTLAEERRELRELAAAHFDFDEMARSTLGYHWRDLTPEQRAQFVPLFKAFIEDAYLDQIQGYSGQDIEINRASPLGQDDVEVHGRVIDNQNEPIELDFMLRQEGADWKIYDVAVDNISITANYRNQFNRVINQQGFDRLVAILKQKQQELSAMLGKR